MPRGYWDYWCLDHTLEGRNKDRTVKWGSTRDNAWVIRKNLDHYVDGAHVCFIWHFPC